MVKIKYIVKPLPGLISLNTDQLGWWDNAVVAAGTGAGGGGGGRGAGAVQRPKAQKLTYKLSFAKPSPLCLGFPCGSAGKESTCNVGDLASILGCEDTLEKGMATVSSILAWRIPWTVQSMGSQRVRCN